MKSQDDTEKLQHHAGEIYVSLIGCVDALLSYCMCLSRSEKGDRMVTKRPNYTPGRKKSEREREKKKIEVCIAIRQKGSSSFPIRNESGLGSTCRTVFFPQQVFRYSPHAGSSGPGLLLLGRITFSCCILTSSLSLSPPDLQTHIAITSTSSSIPSCLTGHKHVT